MQARGRRKGEGAKWEGVEGKWKEEKNRINEGRRKGEKEKGQGKARKE